MSQRIVSGRFSILTLRLNVCVNFHFEQWWGVILSGNDSMTQIVHFVMFLP